MRWAIIGAGGKDSLEFHLTDTLRHLGYEVNGFDLTFLGHRGFTVDYWLRRLSDSYDKAKARKLASEVLKYEPDVVLATYRFVHPLTIELIKKSNSGIRVIHVNPDALINLEQQQVIASAYDFLFTKDPYMVRFLRQMAGLPAFYLPEAFNPRYHLAPAMNRMELEQKTDIDILVFGSMYPYRTRIIDQIAQYGFKVQLYGAEGPFFPERLRKYFSRQLITEHIKSEKILGAKIVLNCFHYAEIEGVNCKYFEINGIGGFQLCDYKPTLKEYSPVEPALYSYNSIKDAVELLRMHLGNFEKRHEIGEMNRNHFLRYHTYEHRIENILETMGFNGTSGKVVAATNEKVTN